MTTKTELRKILRGGLTGEEAGKLVLQDNWLVDRGMEGFLEKRDLSTIKASLKTAHDIQVYNSYIRLYELVDYTLKDAKIYALEAQFYLLWVEKTLDTYLRKAAIDISLLRDMPAIVTQKQYEELKAKQKPLLMRQAISLDEVLEARAGLYRDEEAEEDWPEEWRTAIQEIQELIRAGTLTPLKLKDRKDYYDSLKRQIDCLPAADTVERLDKLLDEGLSQTEEEMDSLLDMTVFLGEELEKSGLPEWKDYTDIYQPSLEDSTLARPPDMMQSVRVAIIQNPKPDEIDERGYWIEKDIFNSREKLDTAKHAEHIGAFLNSIKIRIKSFLAIQAVLEAISQVVGVDFLEDAREWYEGIESIVNIFNSDVDSLYILAHDAMNQLGLGVDEGRRPYQLKIGKMKPTAKSLRYYQDRMAIALGDNWMREAVKSLEYEQAEEGSLAQEMADELAEGLENIAKEAGDD